MSLIRYLPRLFRIGNDVQKKGWYASATIWFNLLVLAFDLLADSLPMLADVPQSEINSIAVGIAAIGNIILRARTERPLGVQTVRNTDDPS